MFKKIMLEELEGGKTRLTLNDKEIPEGEGTILCLVNLGDQNTVAGRGKTYDMIGLILSAAEHSPHFGDVFRAALLEALVTSSVSPIAGLEGLGVPIGEPVEGLPEGSFVVPTEGKA